MILLYRVLSVLFYPVLIVLIFVRKFLNKEHPIKNKEKILPSNFNVQREKKYSKLVWFHAASIGELKSILTILDNLKKKDNLEFLITTVTLSSSNLANKIFKNEENVYHRFFPIDSFFLMKKFLHLWNPSAIFLVDSEIWPNLIFLAKKRKIPLSIINARITKKTFNRWKLFPNTSKEIFSSFALCLTSNNESKDYLFKLNVKNVFYLGNIKFLSKVDSAKNTNFNNTFLEKQKFWCAISTHHGEEKFCLLVHKILRQQIKNLKIIIAPRHINRVIEIKKLCESFDLTAQILNEHDNISKGIDVVIINSYGNLNKFLFHLKSVFIGKSTLKKLQNDGGQNPIEPAKLGCKIYHGPYVYNFQEIYKILKENNISKEINGVNDLVEELISDFKKINKENPEKFLGHIHNLEKKILTDTMKKIDNFLLNENI